MGSFDYTCAVSGLPIHWSDKVRFILLTQNPYWEGGNACYNTDIWFPRAFPLKAQYNDYGTVENVQDGIQQQLWFDGLKLDLIEKGVGDNSCHDVPMNRNLDLDELRAGLYEGRVFVTKEYTDFGHRAAAMMERIRQEQLDRPGVPTLARVSEVLKQAKLDISSGMGSRGYQIDEETEGAVRVRWEGVAEKEWGKNEKFLREAEAVLSKEFGTLLTCGSGGYADDVELLVRPKPGTKTKDGHPFRIYKRDPSKELQVRQAMIREDVWQALLQIKVESWNEKNITVEYWRKNAKAYWDEAIEKADKLAKAQKALAELQTKTELTPAQKAEIQELSFSMFRLDDYGPSSTKDNPLAFMSHQLPSTFGLLQNWKMMVRKHIESPLPKAEVDAWLDVVAETLHVSTVFSWTRYCWRPSESCGPQFGEWKLHAQLFESLHQIAKAKSKDEDDQKEEDEADLEKYIAEEKAKKAKKRAAQRAKAKKAKAEK